MVHRSVKRFFSKGYQNVKVVAQRIAKPVQVYYQKSSSRPQPKIVSLVSPIGLAGGGGAVVGAAKGVYGAAKTAVSRITANPFASASTAKQIVAIGAGGAAATVGLIVGTRAIYSAASGEEFNLPSARTIGLSALGGALISPAARLISAAIGFGERSGKKIVQTVNDLGQPQLPPITTIDWQTPPIPYSFNQGDINIAFPDLSGGNLGLPSQSFAPSISVAPSVQAGGMGADITPLLLALLGGGALGYAVGRRRKKKRKYKKRKRH